MVSGQWKVLLVVAVFLLGACARPPRQQTQLPTQLESQWQMPMAAPEQPRSAGSLWTSQQGSMYGDIKASRVGDIVTVAIAEQAQASKEASTSTDRSSSAGLGIDSLFGLEKNIGTINSTINPSQLVKGSANNEFEGSGETSRQENLTATLTTRVTEVLPNGNMRIEGSKTVTVNNEDQIVALTGIVRPEDVTPDNFINSKYILDARIAYTGKGIISDKQRPGWLVRLLDMVSPL